MEGRFIEKIAVAEPIKERLRDEFAMAALIGLHSHPEYAERGYEWLAETSYNQADAMMKQREK